MAARTDGEAAELQQGRDQQRDPNTEQLESMDHDVMLLLGAVRFVQRLQDSGEHDAANPKLKGHAKESADDGLT